MASMSSDVADPLSFPGQSYEVVVALIGGAQDRNSTWLPRCPPPDLKRDSVSRGQTQRRQRHTYVVEPLVPRGGGPVVRAGGVVLRIQRSVLLPRDCALVPLATFPCSSGRAQCTKGPCRGYSTAGRPETHGEVDEAGLAAGGA